MTEGPCRIDTHTVMVKHVVKRDGRIVIFDNRKIVDAILKAMNVTEEGEDIVLAAEIASAISKINIDNMSVEAQYQWLLQHRQAGALCPQPCR